MAKGKRYDGVIIFDFRGAVQFPNKSHVFSAFDFVAFLAKVQI